LGRDLARVDGVGADHSLTLAARRTHGDTVVAILALVLTLSLTSYASPLLYGFGAFA